MGSPAADITRGVKRRASKACSFCRQRKLRCDNQEPKCMNCRTYDKQCIYVDNSKRLRPSTSRIQELEEENKRLQAQLGSPFGGTSHLVTGTHSRKDETQQEQFSAPSNTTSRPLTPEGSSSLISGSNRRLPPSDTFVEHRRQSQGLRHSPSRNVNPANRESNYYGLTSTLFDDSPTDPRGLQGVAADPKMPVEWIQRGLMAEAARQRQLETVNYNAGKLDFDGVDPELGMHLLSLHWNRQHHSFLVTYRPAFMRDMACGGPYFSKLLLNAIFFGSSKFSPRVEVRRDIDDVRTTGGHYRRRVKELLGTSLDSSEITTIQALLVMTNSLFALGDERSAAWLYAGIALRMIIDLGMHVDAQGLPFMRRLSDEDLEIRRRVFWGAFVVDKIQSLYQGRPASLQDFDTRVPLTFLDHYEELENWTPFAYPGTDSYLGSPAYSVSTFTELCKLCVIMNRILNKVYSEKSKKRRSQELIESLKSLHVELENWRNFLPSHLNFDPLNVSTIVPPPHVLSLLAMYNVLLILLHRPFVAEGHLYTEEPTIAVNSFAACSKAAKTIVRLVGCYDKTFSVGRAPYLISYATYVAATIHVRIAAQRGAGSDTHAFLQTCLSVFDRNKETNWAVRRAKLVIVNLMKRMGVTLASNEQDEPQSEGRGRSSMLHRSGQNSGLAGSAAAQTGSASIPSSTEVPHYPTTPEIDIDMIIQSFMLDQGNKNVPDLTSSGPILIEGDGAALTDAATATTTATTSSSSTTAALVQPVQPGWDYPGIANGDYTVDDLLFGFNGSALDELWIEGLANAGQDF